MIDHLKGFFRQCPLEQVINILKVVVKGFAVDTALPDNLTDGDFGEGLDKV